jgi:hypothetical protein
MNKKGFVLAETLVVTIFVLLIFTVLYNSAIPLLGRYEVMSFYDDLDTTYDLYHLRKYIRNDSGYLNILNEASGNGYKLLKCSNLTLQDIDNCNNIYNLLKIDSTMDEVLLIKKEALKKNVLASDDSISNDLKDYLNHIDFTGNILVLQNDGYISYINI